MKLTNEDNLSLSIAVFLAADFYNHNRHPGKLHMSATGLLKPMRQIILGLRTQEIEASSLVRDINTFIPSRMGTAIHAGIEKAWLHRYREALLALGKPKEMIERIRINPTDIMLKEDPYIIPVYLEQRFRKNFDDFVIDGEADFVGDGVLEDYKSTGVYGYMKDTNDDKYIQQGSIYRWLAPEIITADFMWIQFIFTDWSKLDAMKRKKAGYPQSRIIGKKLVLMSYEETESFIKEKIRKIKKYLNTPEIDLPECTKEELWQNDTTWAYYKNPDGKRATKVYDNPSEAYARCATGGTVVERKGKVRRCSYCDCYNLCSQKNKLIASGEYTPE
jgi:hypothetical protein